MSGIFKEQKSSTASFRRAVLGISLASAMLLSMESLFGYYVYVTNNSTNGTVSVIDSTTQQVITTISGFSNPAGIAVTPNGNYVYVANSNLGGTVSKIDMTFTPPVVTTIAGFSEPRELAATPDGTGIYVTDYFGNAVYVIDVATNAVSPVMLGVFAAFSMPYGVTTAPGNPDAYVTNVGSTTIYQINLASQTVTASYGVSLPNGAIAVTPNNSHVYAGDPTFASLSYMTGTVSGFSGPVRGIAIPENTLGYVTTLTGAGDVQSFDPGTPLTPAITTIATNLGSPVGIAVTPDFAFAYVANNSGTVEAINLSTMAVTSIPGVPNAYAVAIGPAIASPAPLPPQNLTASQKKNSFGIEYEIFNTLKWQVSLSESTLTGYVIYRNGVQIATVGATTFSYEDHNIAKGAVNTYGVAALDVDGRQSTQTMITIP